MISNTHSTYSQPAHVENGDPTPYVQWLLEECPGLTPENMVDIKGWHGAAVTHMKAMIAKTKILQRLHKHNYVESAVFCSFASTMDSVGAWLMDQEDALRNSGTDSLYDVRPNTRCEIALGGLKPMRSGAAKALGSDSGAAASPSSLQHATGDLLPSTQHSSPLSVFVGAPNPGTPDTVSRRLAGVQERKEVAFQTAPDGEDSIVQGPSMTAPSHAIPSHHLAVPRTDSDTDATSAPVPLPTTDNCKKVKL
ncbi:hypothetical protein JB92DRAFT_3120505 [Gautieria morchelliformis]|nr:hypothetical protein JB92DRAFT_3120505 [Gautieria morchelliformis]